jgi:hypothetical protein
VEVGLVPIKVGVAVDPEDTLVDVLNAVAPGVLVRVAVAVAVLVEVRVGVGV